MQVHHPPQQEGDTYHVVALTSSTLGSLDLNSIKFNEDRLIKSDSAAVFEAKKWSAMIEEKIPKVVPKTPSRTPPSEPEMINVWEMMEGLEDSSPVTLPRHHHRCFSSDVLRDSVPSPCDSPVPSPCDSPLSTLKENGDDGSVSSISEFGEKRQALAGNVKLINDDGIDYNFNGFNLKTEDRVVLYFTSLRGVRKTYQDCCHVKVILKGIGVRIDERDISMHSGFKEELKELLGDGYFSERLGLPMVFVGKKYIGGADEIRRLHEEGKLEKILEGCEMDNSGGGVCEACGDVKFVPCETCSGSCKIYYEGDHDYEEDEKQCNDGYFGFQRCPDCNENGIVRCPICCD